MSAIPTEELEGFVNAVDTNDILTTRKYLLASAHQSTYSSIMRQLALFNNDARARGRPVRPMRSLLIWMGFPLQHNAATASIPPPPPFLAPARPATTSPPAPGSMAPPIFVPVQASTARPTPSSNIPPPLAAASVVRHYSAAAPTAPAPSAPAPTIHSRSDRAQDSSPFYC
ncbi:related to VRP1-Proline-rich actin-associated protein involved in cytoskeletal organization and cytokinesis [Sporisorium scitamineum]|uniref:Related to VRP1-Proline-rich actin-associated protein involved in cytoskeletal organization and cytokinesis n=1 Tax=Sporisorium scitamineum TaxID=49012 RepID=A0A0F7S1A5_9BASI|nr:related to VRP1-Proline-rich actin-associated protein involved in cytoskeletal organization and cytokinesis [Sporisorium scitamineum]CDS00752.1 hypothetical protein [Sporisorium scitamineum]